MNDLKTHAVREFHENADEFDLYAEEIRNVGYTVMQSDFSTDELQIIRQKIDDIYQLQVREIGGEQALKQINDANLARCLLGYDDHFLKLVDVIDFLSDD